MKFLALVAIFYICGQAKFIPVSGTPLTIGDAPGGRNPFIVTNNQRVPYITAIYMNGRYFCIGSLISQRWVLTAGHCASGFLTFTVHLGVQSISNVNEPGRVVIETTQKVVHSGYNSLTLTNDIALINLGQDIPLNAYVQTIGLPSGSNNYDGSTASFCFWGRSPSPSVSAPIKCENVTVISSLDCQSNLVYSSKLCFLGSASTCDVNIGGAPLVDLASNKQIGIIGFQSPNRCDSDTPIGAARVSSYLSWITSNTGIGA